jgi:glycine betaine/proline transport system permease protein
MAVDLKKLTGLVRANKSESVRQEGREGARKLSLVVAVIVVAVLVSIVVNGNEMESAKNFPVNLGPTVTGGIDSAITWVITNWGWFFDAISHNLKIALGKLRDFLIWVPWPVVVGLVFLIGWRVASIRVGVASAIGLVIIGIVNLWEPAMVTIAIMTVSVAIAVGIGIPLGILAARSNAIDTFMRPILDAMQTMPSFVYLVPGIMLFGLGNVAAILATVLYAIPPCIRLTSLGIRQVDSSVVEAGRAFGATPLQILFNVQIPMAVPTIMAGINQTVMMALAMATIAAMVGAGGLGIEVLRSMGQLEEGKAFVAGAGIVVMAIIIDRISQGFILSRRTE